MNTITIRLSNAAATELYHSEYGSYEDQQNDMDAGAISVLGRWSDAHACDIIMRGKRRQNSTTITLLDDSEAAEMYYAICSGTFQLDYKGYLRTAKRLADQLRDAARRHSAELVRSWPAPSGY